MSKRAWFNILIIGGVIVFVLSNARIRMLFGMNSGEPVGSDGEYELISLLPKDAIRSIDNPRFVTGAEANAQYSEDELVLGVEINGDARAYSIPFLSGHEIVNDVVGGEPIAVTW